MSGPEEPGMEQQDNPNKSNNDTDWLNELGKEPTKIYNEDGPSNDKDPNFNGDEGIDDEIPDWMTEDLEQDDPMDEAVPDWLKDEIAAEESESPDRPAADRSHDIEDTAVFEQSLNLSEDEIPEWLKDEVDDKSASFAESEKADDLSWLDQIAAGEGAAIEEPPTLSWDEQEQEDQESLDDQAEEDMTWLDDMSTLPAVTAEELAARSGESSEPSHDEEEQTTQEEALDLEDSPEAVPEDPDEAMAWLEKLAARQGAPAEELPSFAEDSQLYSAVDAGEMPEDPDEAMAWLEKMSGEQEEPEEEIVEAYQEVQDEPEDEEAIGEDEAITGVVAEEDVTESADEELEYALSGLEGVEMPDDMDEALSWLEDMIVEEDSKPIDEAPTLTEEVLLGEESAEFLAETQETSEDLTVEEDEEPIDISMESMVEEQVDDEEDAMAWLEQLAARQGAPLEELTTIEAEGEEPEAPEWLRQEMDEALDKVVETEPEASEELAAEEALAAEEEVAAEEVEAVSAMDVHEVEEPTLEEEPLKLDSELAEIFEEEALEEPEPTEPVFEFEDIPEVEEWSESEGSTGQLDPSVVDEATQEDLAWMDSLGEADPESWLEAEVEATSPELAIPENTPETDQAIDQQAPDQEALDLEVEDGEEPEVEPVELLGEVDGVLNAEHLQAARGAIAAGNLDTALNEFGALLQQGEGLPYLIAELQSSLRNYGEQPRLQRLLGDAYVENGQLKKAIEVYRQALDNL